MSVNRQVSAAGIFADLIICDAKMERTLPPCAEFDAFQPISLNEALRLSCGRKPRSPNLHRHSPWIARTPGAPGIHQQIAKPPG